MAATNITSTTQPAATRSSTLSNASSNPAVQSANQAQNQSLAAMGPGIFNWQLPNIMPSLDQFLGLPAVIDYQDIAIRAGLVLTGVILVILVAWAFVRGKQSTTVNVQVPPTGGHIAQEAEEAAEVA